MGISYRYWYILYWLSPIGYWLFPIAFQTSLGWRDGQASLVKASGSTRAILESRVRKIREKYETIRDIGIPNSYRFWIFTMYLPELVYWVGFVTGMTFTMHLWIVDFIDFWCVGKISLRTWAVFFSNLSFLLNFVNPLYQNVCIDHRSTFIFL